MAGDFFPVVGDIELTPDGSDFEIVGGVTRVVQDIRAVMQTFRGDDRYNESEGLDLFADPIVRADALPLLVAQIVSAVQAIPGVTQCRVISATLDRNTRIATVKCDTRTDFGSVRDTLRIGRL